MATKELLQAVITANQGRQNQARQLNMRAGENVFPVMNTDEVVTWLQDKLGDATSIAAIADADVLRLPALDENVIDLVKIENPDQIELLGQSFQVVYQSGCAPRVTLNGEAMTLWKDLPDAGVQLPGGRYVEIVAYVSAWETIAQRDISTLKQRVRERLNAQQWNSWNRPELPAPDITSDNVVLPGITTAQYGTCVATGIPLLAYGILVVFRPCAGGEPYLATSWYQKQEEAARFHADVPETLANYKRIARNQRELNAARQQAEAAQARAVRLYDRYYTDPTISLELPERDYILSRRYCSLPTTTAELTVWAAQTEAICSDVETALAEIKRRQAKRAAYETAARSFKYRLAHVLVDDEGNVAVNCGRLDQGRSFEAGPVISEREVLDTSLDCEGVYAAWHQIPLGEQVRCQFFERGTSRSKAEFTVQAGQLTPGVWALAKDGQGQFFFPAIYYHNFTEIVPDGFVIVREVKQQMHDARPLRETVVSPAAVDMSQLFGGQVRVQTRDRKKK